MNKQQRESCAELRRQTSQEAFRWLVAKFPPEDGTAVGEALALIPHRSWAKGEQIRLFDIYFTKSFPKGWKALEVFPKFMSGKLLVKLIEDLINKHLHNDSEKLKLAKYRLQYLDGLSSDLNGGIDTRILYELIDQKLIDSQMSHL